MVIEAALLDSEGWFLTSTGTRTNFHIKEARCRCRECDLDLVDQRLVDVMQATRDVVGGPIHVTSWIRCPQHNARVGGAPRSTHVPQFWGGLNKAVDFSSRLMGVNELAIVAGRFLGPKGGISAYESRGFVHVDVRPTWAMW